MILTDKDKKIVKHYAHYVKEHNNFPGVASLARWMETTNSKIKYRMLKLTESNVFIASSHEHPVVLPGKNYVTAWASANKGYQGTFPKALLIGLILSGECDIRKFQARPTFNPVTKEPCESIRAHVVMKSFGKMF